jgi:FAD/FMN-containing dehydrogenase
MKRREFCGAVLSLPAIDAMAASSEMPSELPARRLAGTTTVLKKSALTGFAREFRGAVITASHPDYANARRVWNPMADRNPALIARCSDARAVVGAVNFAREHDLLLAVRGGGHSFPGHSTCDGGMVIDLSALREVRVDAQKRVALVAPGAWGADVDEATQKHSLATTMGQISDTGAAGLTLGGGYGWLSRKFGLACDNLLAVDMVTADGKQRRVSATEEPDLFWAIRGGGGNFGIATSFEYRLHEQNPKVYTAYVAYPWEKAREVAALYQEVTERGPRGLSLDLSFGAESGSPRIAIYACHSGDPAEGPKLMEPFERLTKPLQSVHGPDSYLRVQHQFDGPHHSPNHHYIKAGLIPELKPELVDLLQREFTPNAQLFVWLQNASGAVGDVAPSDTAFWHRKSTANLMILAEWKNPADTDRIRDSVRALWDKVAPFTQGYYANLSDSDGSNSRRAFGGNLPRLEALKRRYDPDNRFRLNSNIKPAAT